MDLNELYHRPNLELARNVGSRLFNYASSKDIVAKIVELMMRSFYRINDCRYEEMHAYPSETFSESTIREN